MIRFKTMKWANAFSYGPNNSIDFSSNPLTQILGRNGHGKSSIALILEEVLYNKNSKGTKKAAILNRYSNSTSYNVSLDFSKGLDEFNITTVRGSTQTVKLFKNGIDISAHTSTATYKLIEEIIGLDHKSFSQIVYQSSPFSLEFLTATDSNRKKFLIDLLNLVKYTTIGENIKSTLKDISNKSEVVSMKHTTVNNWFTKFSKESIDEMPLLNLPDNTDSVNAKQELVKLTEEIVSIDVTNKKVAQNNKYKEILASINIEPAPQPKGDLVHLTVCLNEASSKVKTLTQVIQGIGPILTKCPACGQAVDNSHKQKMVDEAKEELPIHTDLVTTYTKQINIARTSKLAFDKYTQNQQEWERYYSFIDNSLPNELLDINSLTKQKIVLQSVINKYEKDLANVNSTNATITAHNAKVRVLVEQLATMQLDKDKYSKELAYLSARVSNLQILVKAFGTSGLVAYKIECLVKDLEDLTNEYLQGMSDGRFQLGFNISASDKLDVVITDNGQDIDISALSNGELARVNISTLLAIRKLMQSLSDTRINLLILDETVERLDQDGKDKLIELLLKEDSLNTILVSHGFTHPLLEKVYVTKTNNISRIE